MRNPLSTPSPTTATEVFESRTIPLSTRMLEAAATVLELNQRYALGDHVPWDPESLLREADVVRAEERETQGTPA